VIVRGAGWHELAWHGVILSGMAAIMLALSMLKFRKQLA
jgi:hypothetical protein